MSCEVADWEERERGFMQPRLKLISTDPNDTIAPPSQDEGVTLEMRLRFLRRALERPNGATLVMFEAKEQLKTLHLAMGMMLTGKVEDPKVAAWMIQPSDKERNLSNLAMNYDHLGGNEVGAKKGCMIVATTSTGMLLFTI